MTMTATSKAATRVCGLTKPRLLRFVGRQPGAARPSTDAYGRRKIRASTFQSRLEGRSVDIRAALQPRHLTPVEIEPDGSNAWPSGDDPQRKGRVGLAARRDVQIPHPTMT